MTTAPNLNTAISSAIIGLNYFLDLCVVLPPEKAVTSAIKIIEANSTVFSFFDF